MRSIYRFNMILARFIVSDLRPSIKENYADEKLIGKLLSANGNALITLKYLARGTSFRSLREHCGIRVASVSRAIDVTTASILST